MEKLKVLKKSFEEKIISKEEYEKEKEKLEKKLDNKNKEEENKNKEITKKSDKILMVAILLILILIAVFFVVVNYNSSSRPKTIDELHQTNLEENLPSEQGYIYNQYSFVKLGGLWYTQIQSKSGKILYDIPFHFSPKELEDLKIKGQIDKRFANATDIYISLNPLSKDPNVVLALTELTGSLIRSFDKKPIVACDRNETISCINKSIVTCEDKDKAIVHFIEDEKTKIVFNGNCITIQGQGTELVRAVDRILFQWYGIMK